MQLNRLLLDSKIVLLSIPIIIIVAGLWWLYMEL
jgi:hypothetical protein